MAVKSWRPVAGVLFALALAGAVKPAWADCGTLRAQSETAQAAGDTAVLRALYEKVAVEPDCDDAFRTQFGRAVARAIEKKAYQAVTAGQKPDAFEDDLKASLRYARNWRPLAWLGDIESERRNYTAASRHYQDALVVIQDEVATPKAPPPDVIGQIFHQAEQMRLLADSYVAAPSTRSGEPSGLGAVSVRGFVPTKVAVPIEFKFGSIDLTPKGDAAAKDLHAHLKAQGSPPITLIGHTDPVGSPTGNMALSERRAAMIRDFLVKAGYEGRVRIEGRGAAEPMAVDDPERYSTEQLHQLYRRVELQR